MHLPLKEDFGEAKPVFDCISYLYQMGAPQLTNHVDRVILAAVEVIGTKKVEDGEFYHFFIFCQSSYPCKIGILLKTSRSTNS